MGCWNETCAVSQMSIFPGEEVLFLVLRQNPYLQEPLSGYEGKPTVLPGKNGCYNSDFWEPLSYPIKAKYNDYGSIEDIDESPENQAAVRILLSRVFCKALIKLEVGDNSCHDIAIDPKKKTMKQLLNGLTEARLFHLYPRNDTKVIYPPINADGTYPKDGHKIETRQYEIYLPLAGIFIKEAVWQSLIETKLSTWRETVKLEAVKKQIRDAFLAYKEVSLKLKTSTKDTVLEAAMAQHKLKDSLYDKVRMDSPFSAGSGGVARNLLFTDELKIEDRELCIDIDAEFCYIHGLLSQLRITYAPTTGSGSQGDNLETYVDVFSRWSKLAKKQVEEREEDY